MKTKHIRMTITSSFNNIVTLSVRGVRTIKHPTTTVIFDMESVVTIEKTPSKFQACRCERLQYKCSNVSRIAERSFPCSGSAVPPANYSEPRSHKSLVRRDNYSPRRVAETDNATIHNNRFLGQESVIKQSK